MSKLTAIFTALVDSSIASAKGSQSEAQASALAIMASPDPAGAMGELFTMHRGRYLMAKADGDKDMMGVMSTAWNSVKTGMGYWFQKRDFRGNWPNYRSGEGVCELAHVEDLNAKRKAEREQRAEREQAETAQARANSAAKAAEIWAAASMADQLAHILSMVDSSGRTEELTNALTNALRDRDEAAARAVALKVARAEKRAARKATATA